MRSLSFLPVFLFAAAVAGPAAGPDPAAALADADRASRPIPLNKEGTVLLDRPNRILIVKTEVVFREGMLEMLLCKRQTKEHESILAFDGRADMLHAGLVAMGLDPGTPVVFSPEYAPPSGPKLKVEVVWTDEAGKERREDARSWVRHSIHRYFGEPFDALPPGLTLPDSGDLRYDAVNKELSWYGPMSDEQRDGLLALSDDAAFRKAVTAFYDRTRLRPMEAEWVFAGSGFATDETTGRRVYLAEAGDVICVANFSSATIDVAARSSAEGEENLLYEAWTERVPPVGTPVRLEISPAASEPAADAAAGGRGDPE